MPGAENKQGECSSLEFKKSEVHADIEGMKDLMKRIYQEQKQRARNEAGALKEEIISADGDHEGELTGERLERRRCLCGEASSVKRSMDLCG